MAKKFEILDRVDTPLGVFWLRRRELLCSPGTIVTEITVDEVLLMSSHHTQSEEALATRAIALLDEDGSDERSDLRVLVGGLGLGHTVAAALATGRVAAVRVVELMECVVGWHALDLVPLAGQLAADARVTIEHACVYTKLLDPPSPADLPWDAILIDVDHAPDAQLDRASDRFYREEGLRRVAAHLVPGGVLAVWSTDASEAFEAALRAVFPVVRSETIEWYNELIDEDTTHELFLARTAPAD